MNATQRLKQAEKGAILSIITYIILSSSKLLFGKLFFSQALFSDGLNNLTDVLSSVLVFAGLKISQKPADKNHPYGHWKFETLASLITSFIMCIIGIEVIRKRLVYNHESKSRTSSPHYSFSRIYFWYHYVWSLSF